MDEIQEYVDARYISASEAHWRISGFSMHEEYPSVVRLAVHLPGQQNVVFDSEDPNAISAVEERGAPKTTLTEWFALNAAVPAAREHLYEDVAGAYRFHPGTKKWEPRKRFPTGRPVGRVYTVNPREGERFYLRLLLSHVRGATSYDDVRTFDGTVYDTFKEACAARGLLASDDEWDRCLTDAAQCTMPRQMRELFAFLLVFCNPTDPKKLWDDHKEAMCEDILHNCRRYRRPTTAPGDPCPFADLALPHPDIEDAALTEIDTHLQLHGLALGRGEHTWTGLPNGAPRTIAELHATMYATAPRRGTRYIESETAYAIEDQARIVQEGVPRLNPEQRAIYDAVIAAFDDPTRHPRRFFIDSPGGCGKTFLMELIMATVRSRPSASEDGRNRVAIAVASSGIAALLLPGGTTAHSRFGIPPKTLDDSIISSIKPNSEKGKILALLAEGGVLVWDEAVMHPKRGFAIASGALQDCAGSLELFANVPTVVAGDFRQTLPVVRQGSRARTVAEAFNKGDMWKHFTRMSLTRNMRVARLEAEGRDPTAQAEWAQLLLAIGDGRILPDWEVPPDMLLPEDMSPAAIVTHTFGDLANLLSMDPDDLITKAILTPKNKYVKDVNAAAHDFCPGEDHVLLSCDSVDPTEPHPELYPIGFLNSMDLPDLPLHKLHLKVGQPIMLLRNLNTAMGLANGTRLTIDSITFRLITATIRTGKLLGRRVFIPRIKCTVGEGANLPFQMTRIQFPIRQCFAMTINKSQGQTLKACTIFLPSQVFSHGQLYVAMSRCGERSGVKIAAHRDMDLEPDSPLRIKNVVFTEVFAGM